jgi:hypothetical protein
LQLVQLSELSIFSLSFVFFCMRHNGLAKLRFNAV